MNNSLKNTLKEFNKQIKLFNKKYNKKYELYMYYDFNPENEEGLWIYLYDYKGDKIFTWKILEVIKYEPKKVIFDLIEKGYIRGEDNE